MTVVVFDVEGHNHGPDGVCCDITVEYRALRAAQRAAAKMASPDWRPGSTIYIWELTGDRTTRWWVLDGRTGRTLRSSR